LHAQEGKEERNGRRVAFGDVVDLAGGRVGEEPDGDLPLLAVAERLAGAAFVRHFGAWSGGGDGRGGGGRRCGVHGKGVGEEGGAWGRRSMATRADGTREAGGVVPARDG